MTSSPVDLLAWTDLETTGLVAHQEHLLEVACLITDTDLNLVDEAGFQRVVRYDSREVTQMRSAADGFVRTMHDTSGLWDRLPEGTPLADVDGQLLAYISRWAPEPRQARMAGSSLRLDMNFTDQWLPATAAHLHYRFVDVSGMAFLANAWAGVPYMVKERKHTALDDIRESLAELKHLREHGMFRPAV